MNWFILEESVCDPKIVQYTEFNHLFSINVDAILCLFDNDIFRIVAEFRFRLSIKVSTSDYSFSSFECLGTGCFRFLYIDFEVLLFNLTFIMHILLETGVKLTFEFSLISILVPAIDFVFKTRVV